MHSKLRHDCPTNRQPQKQNTDILDLSWRTRRSVTPSRRGRVGVKPQARLDEETFQEVEAVREYELDSFESGHAARRPGSRWLNLLS